MKKIFRFTKPYRKQIILGPMFKMVEAVFELIVPLVMARMIDIGIKQNNIPYVFKMGGVLVVLGIVGLCSTLICQFYASRASQGTGTILRKELFHHINTLSYKELDKVGTSSMIIRINNDVNQLQLAVAMLIRLVFRAPFLVIGATIMAMGLDLQMSLIFFLAAAAFALILYIVMSRSVPYYKLVQKLLDKVSLITRENLGGARVIRAFSRQKDENKRFQESSEEFRQAAIRVSKLSALLNPFTAVVANGAIIAIVWFGGMRVNMGTLSQGEIIAFWNYMTQILLALIVVANLVMIFTKASASASRVNEIFDTKSTILDEENQEQTPISGAPKIEFENVSFCYQEGEINFFEELNFSIDQGQTIGIIGGTGSGKSTLVNLLCRLYDTGAGKILIDGIDVKDYPFSQLRGEIGIVPQQAVLFSGTIRENMQWRKEDAGDEEIWEALAIAQGAEIVSKMPDGLDTKINQGGKNLSGGQRQRFTIARALVGKPDILILDDSASALDFATDAALRKALKEKTKEMTVIMISQRANTVKGADSIIVLDDGKAVGIGTHGELLETCKVYEEICLSQLSKEEVKRA